MTRSIVYFVDSVVFGGTEQALLNLLSGLDRRQWRPTVFPYDEPGLAPLLEGARTLDVKLRAVPRQDKTGRTAAAVTLFRELRAERPAIFHAHLNWQSGCRLGLVVAAAARVPVRVATVQLFVDLPRSVSLYVWRRYVTAWGERGLPA